MTTLCFNSPTQKMHPLIPIIAVAAIAICGAAVLITAIIKDKELEVEFESDLKAKTMKGKLKLQ